MVDISGLDKAEVLAALFNGSKQQGMGFLDASGASPMTVEDAREVIADYGLRFDYLRGRVMKVNLTGDTFLPGLYDRDVGEGAAERVVSKLRERIPTSR